MANEQRSCSVCKKSASEVPGGLKNCAACHERPYCSKDCQKTDWKQHKRSCGKKPNEQTDDGLSGLGEQFSMAQLEDFTRKMKEADAVARAEQASRPPEALPATSKEAPSSNLVKGVRLECAKKGNGFSKTRIPDNHPILDEKVLPVPGLIGIPLVIYKVDTKRVKVTDPGLDNQKATFLNIDATTEFAPDGWQGGRIGSCIVARKDKKPLREEHFEAVWMYIDRILDDFGDGGYEMARRWYSRPKFEKWFAVYNREQLQYEQRSGWKEDPGSPYDV
ncbi:hypothetical protein P171DRAFT_426616 [Karstenula rhodostoma CBS 690.94]|uniref:MYND-type domain-containing protein n=1 Tax=Karstenula rhodostoma CBS 690.94 TaxID=1392251 RepID=A0A9P4UHF2_9PLEO|nr:hypothetical protein P171DRAFT_426616 [Karstenula rhodostoma CBS 690.94]